jgi:adenine-specific DNA methylase
MDIIENNDIEADIIYLDPPYNSREYTSNYHLLNLIADYHNIDNPKKYEK